MNYTYVVIRHLSGAFPVAHKVLTRSWELSDYEEDAERDEARDDFCRKFPEFKGANWYINKVD